MAASVEVNLEPEPGAVARLRRVLDDFGYDPLLRAVRGSYPLIPFPPYVEFRRRSRTLPARERLWFELLLLGRALPEAAVRDGIGQAVTDDLLALRVLTRRGARLSTPSLGLTSLDGRYALASLPRDYPTCRDQDLHAYVGHETYLLAHFLPPGRPRAALDLCSGSGVLALALADRAERVTAVDIDPVSARVGSFNAALNGNLGHISTRLGDLWQPVAGETFDLITFNAPFVPTPDGYRHVAFRDGGEDGLSVLGRVLDGLATHLTADGCAVAYAEGFGGETEPFLARRLAEVAERDALAIDLVLLKRLPIGLVLKEVGTRGRIPRTAYRRLATEQGARRYHRMAMRIRRGAAGLRMIDACRYL